MRRRLLISLILICILLISACSTPNIKVNVVNNTSTLTENEAASLASSVYKRIYEKYAGIAELKNPEVEFFEESIDEDGHLVVKVGISIVWISTISSDNYQYLKGMAKYLEEDKNIDVQSAYATMRDNLDKNYKIESRTGVSLLVEFPEKTYSEEYTLYDRFDVEEGTLKAEFDDTPKKNDQTAYQEGYENAKAIAEGRY